MSEMRQDPVTGTWTILAPARAGRPKDFSRPRDEAADSSNCPFCPGHEAETPPARLELALPGEQGWAVRVFANRFPALDTRSGDGLEPVEAPAPYCGQPGFGEHEIIVETPQHDGSLADYGPEQAAVVARAYAERLRHWREDGRFAAAVLFRNFGRAAGASLAHPHTQLLAMPRVPRSLVHEVGNFSSAASEHGSCLLCTAMSADDSGGRAVFDDGVCAVHSPWAAPIPYFMRISPRRCSRSLADAQEAEIASFGRAMIAAASALRGVFGEVAFNIVVSDAPFSAQNAGLPFHWHADVIPRTSDHAGLEWSSGTYINVIDPDVAAASLRSGCT